MALSPRFVAEARSRICFFSWERRASLDWNTFVSAGGRPPPDDANNCDVDDDAADDTAAADGERTDDIAGGSIGENAEAD